MTKTLTSEAQLAANRINAQASTGPRSAAGKARVAQNSVTLGLFSARDLVRPEEQSEYDELRDALEAELLPATAMERTHAMEILHATWRLRRCALTEAGLNPDDPEEMTTVQATIDRARAHARNNLHRATADLSRLQTERHLRAHLAPETAEALVSHQTIAKTLAHDTRRRLNLRKLEELDTFESIFAQAAGIGAFQDGTETPADPASSPFSPPITKQTQSADPPRPCMSDDPGTHAFHARPLNNPPITKQTQSAAPSDPQTPPYIPPGNPAVQASPEPQTLS